MIRQLVSFLVAIVVVTAVVFGWMNLSHSLRLRRVRRQYDQLPFDAIDKVLTCIDQAGRNDSECSILVAQPKDLNPAGSDSIVQSHFGGVPYAEVGHTWPTEPLDAGEGERPAIFLIQVLLDDSFPSQWAGRLIAVYHSHETEQIVRSYRSPSPDKFVAITGAPERPAWRLRPIRIPRQIQTTSTRSESAQSEQTHPSSQGLLDYDPIVLLKSVPNLQPLLAPVTRQPADLLAAVLAPNHCGYGFELSDIVQVGGNPVWLQEGLDGLTCDFCTRAMRFLFQFGDLNGDSLFGEAGVCYVFGCDDHSDHVRAIVQTT